MSKYALAGYHVGRGEAEPTSELMKSIDGNPRRIAEYNNGITKGIESVTLRKLGEPLRREDRNEALKEARKAEYKPKKSRQRD